MATGAIHILQKSLEAARKDLTSTNDAIKRLTGRDPTSKPMQRNSNTDRRPSGSNREPERRITAPIRVERRFSERGGERRVVGPSSERRGNDGGRMRAWTEGMEGPAAKRRDVVGSKSRLAGRLGSGPRDGGGPPHRRREEERERETRPRSSSFRESKLRSSGGEDMEEKDSLKPSLQSSVVATKVPPRPTTNPNEDEKSKKRNRRMFGFLMGTLQKFKDSEDVAKSSDKERRRAEIEEKLEQKRELEKEEAVQERNTLFQELKTKKSKIARINNQMFTIKNYEEWNAHDRLLLGYIKTKASPPIFYSPAEHTAKTEKLFRETQLAIEEKISERQREIESFVAEDGEEEVKQKDPVVKVELGEREDEGRGRRAGSDSSDGSDKEP